MPKRWYGDEEYAPNVDAFLEYLDDVHEWVPEGTCCCRAWGRTVLEGECTPSWHVGRIAEGTKLLCQIHRRTSSRSGELRDEQGIVRGRFGRSASASRWGLRNPFKKADFAIVEPGARELIIRRVSFIPPVFNIIEAERVIGTIKMISVFRNKYSISIDGVKSWTFRMPLFTIFFFGESSTGAEIWVQVGPSEKEWNVLIKPGVITTGLVAALAFIHNERYFYG
jgi:hypothetical protein